MYLKKKKKKKVSQLLAPMKLVNAAAFPYKPALIICFMLTDCPLQFRPRASDRVWTLRRPLQNTDLVFMETPMLILRSLFCWKSQLEACLFQAARGVVVKLLDLDPQGRWFDPWCGHNKICTAVGPLSKALNPTLLRGECLLRSLINCKSLWIKASAKWHGKMVNGLHLYSAFIQSALLFMPLIHPFTHTFTHKRRLAAMQGTNQTCNVMSQPPGRAGQVFRLNAQVPGGKHCAIDPNPAIMFVDN